MTTVRKRILIVEDDDTLRETLTEVFVDEGHEVRAAAHGSDALDQLRDWEPDLIVLDLMMPTMDAFEFRTRQRELGIASGAQTIVLSAARDLGAAAERLEADGWIGKPFLLAEVVAAVDRLLTAPS